MGSTLQAGAVCVTINLIVHLMRIVAKSNYWHSDAKRINIECMIKLRIMLMHIRFILPNVRFNIY